MNLLFEVFVKNSYLMDAIGVLGLGLLGLASVRLSQRYRSWGGSLLASGAMLLLLGRLWVLVGPILFTPDLRMAMGGTADQLVSLAPMALMTLGLAGVVWGLWGHEQWLREQH
jgi:hypothetical protein